jgi:hypothetical protein
MITVTAPPPATYSGDLSYDPDPSTLILTTGMLPPATECQHAMFAGLRLWGDGLLYLNDALIAPGESTLWGATLSPSHVAGVLTFLKNQGFMNDWTPSAADRPSGAGTGMTLAVHLRHYSIAHSWDSTDWPFYRALLNYLIPMLRPIIPNADTDRRMLNMDNGAPDCITATRVRPDYTATLAVLETQQPSARLEPFEGICECISRGIIPWNFVVRNSWQRMVSSELVLVEAGTSQDSPDVGLLAVTHNRVDWVFYNTPANTGAVRISAEQNKRLTLQSAQGATYYFDVPSLKFADSLSQFVPTATPVPAGYPIASTLTTPPKPSAYPAP